MFMLVFTKEIPKMTNCPLVFGCFQTTAKIDKSGHFRNTKYGSGSQFYHIAQDLNMTRKAFSQIS